MPEDSAFIVVDAERGFSELCPDELPVPGALAIVPVINRLLALPWKRKIATLDWHPQNHCSFKEMGGPYNRHCVQNSAGALFLPELKQEEFQAIFRKGFRQDKDAYSVFVDHPYLLDGLKDAKAIYLVGICTNICVFETARDLAKPRLPGREPFLPVYIIEDACAALPLPENNPFCPEIVKEQAMKCGIEYITSKELLGNAGC